MPKSKGPDFEAEFISAIRTNVTLVLDSLDAKDPGLMKRIATFASRFDYAVAEVEKKIRKDEMFRAWFAKDPGKQKIHENIAAVFIAKIPGVKDFTQLGHNALVVFQGVVSPRREVHGRGASATAKTIDFEWNYKGIRVLASHKYTKQSGGAQDNQYHDLQEFIRQANESNLQNTLFLALADGDYYNLADTGSRMTKLQRLQDIANKRNVFALTTGDLASWMNATIR